MRDIARGTFMSPSVAPSSWHRTVARLFRSDVPIKAFGTMLFIAVFFGAYFYLLKHPASTPVVMRLTALDSLVSPEPLALPLYFSLWVYVSLPPVLLATRRELCEYGLAMALMCLAGLIIFYFWPTAVPEQVFGALQQGEPGFLKTVDASGNACPSLHVATAIFSGFWLHRLLRRIGSPAWVVAFSGIWCAGIVYSTVATRQHVVLDVLGGLALGLFAAWISLRCMTEPAIVADPVAVQP